MVFTSTQTLSPSEVPFRGTIPKYGKAQSAAQEADQLLEICSSYLVPKVDGSPDFTRPVGSDSILIIITMSRRGSKNSAVPSDPTKSNVRTQTVQSSTRPGPPVPPQSREKQQWKGSEGRAGVAARSRGCCGCRGQGERSQPLFPTASQHESPRRKRRLSQRLLRLPDKVGARWNTNLWVDPHTQAQH